MLCRNLDGISGCRMLVYSEERDTLSTEDILSVIKNTHSLSEIMKEPLKKMSQEYENRKFKNASEKE